jgi:hypothetical protein
MPGMTISSRITSQCFAAAASIAPWKVDCGDTVPLMRVSRKLQIHSLIIE